jgi:hypothetical protein
MTIFEFARARLTDDLDRVANRYPAVQSLGPGHEPGAVTCTLCSRVLGQGDHSLHSLQRAHLRSSHPDIVGTIAEAMTQVDRHRGMHEGEDCPTVRSIASRYSRHPDYCDAWNSR